MGIVTYINITMLRMQRDPIMQIDKYLMVDDASCDLQWGDVMKVGWACTTSHGNIDVRFVINQQSAILEAKYTNARRKTTVENSWDKMNKTSLVPLPKSTQSCNKE